MKCPDDGDKDYYYHYYMVQSNKVSNLPNELHFDKRLYILGVGVLVLLQLINEVLHLSRVLEGGSTELGAVLTNKP
jgi:hypothetical protein